MSDVIGKATNIYPGNRLIRISTDLDTLDKKITISPSFLDSVIAGCLNVNNYYANSRRGNVSNYGSLDDAKERLELLKTVRSATQLKREFSYLADAFRQTKQIKIQLERAKNASDELYQQLLDFYCISEMELEFFNNCDSILNFIEYSCLAFEGIINNYDQLKDLYKEKDLENSIIDNISKFLLELGKGFMFVGSQVRITLDEKHFYPDLIFYNRLLKCFVIIDLKIGEVTHQDIGQMQIDELNKIDKYDRKHMSDEDFKRLKMSSVRRYICHQRRR